ncbi:hypothetical protein A3750_18510 [Oleiphilus sp. HI0079]|nr:hypothetical protein A3750_18510 [Oleiphilus sp. HI0079]
MKRLLLIVISLAFMPVASVYGAGEGQPYYGGIEIFATQSELVSEKVLIETTAFFVEQEGLGTLEDQRLLTFDDAGKGKRIYMGVSSAPDWDWEWGYVDFGKTSGRYQGDSSSSTLDMKTDVKAEGWFLHFQYTPRITERLEWNLKLGILRWDGSRYSRMTMVDPVRNPVEKFESISGIDEYFGTGLLYTVNERWKIRADANRYMLADDQVDTFSIAAQFWFTGRLINNIFDY